MTLKAVLFDFNGIIINDEPIHDRLIEQLMLEENLRLKAGEFRNICLGRSDRACLTELLSRKGRVVTEAYLTQLIARKAKAYRQAIEELETLPIYPELEALILQLRERQLKLGVVTGALRSEVELVLNRAGLAKYFEAIVAGDDVTVSKPEPDGYLLAVERLGQQFPSLNLKASECLAIEDTFAGIAAAYRAEIPVVGVAHSYPLHMLQRMSTWAIDRFSDLELDRIQQTYAQPTQQPATGEILS